MNLIRFLIIVCTVAIVSACGRPPPAGGPPADYSVSAVVAPAANEPVSDIARVVGSLRARDAVDVVSELSAPVKEILFREGEAVKAGQPLVQLDDDKVSARVAEAEARFRLAQTNRKRSEELLESQTISRQEFDQVSAEFGVAEAVFNLLKRELEDAVIKAPFDGLISDRQVSPGQLLSVGQAVTRLVRMDPLEVEFNLSERQAVAVEAGQKIIMRAAASTIAPVEGEVFFIDPVVDPQSRTVLVKALIPNPEFQLKPGMYGNIELILNVREDALVIPESAVRYRGDQAYVVIVNAELRAEFRNVAVGQRMPGKVEITDGLAAGERVVVEGFQKMGPGTGIIISPASARYGIEP
jgi:membrane fusion protein (multidrug efflux system)